MYAIEIFYSEEDEGYIAIVPELPGCSAFGEIEERALLEVKITMQLLLEAAKDMGAEVLGISRDSPASHRKFAEKHGLGVKLASDTDHKVTEAYGAWGLKKMYGNESYGAVRSTFLIDPYGKVAYIWRKVSVKGHSEAVEKKLGELKGYGK